MFLWSKKYWQELMYFNCEIYRLLRLKQSINDIVTILYLLKLWRCIPQHTISSQFIDIMLLNCYFIAYYLRNEIYFICNILNKNLSINHLNKFSTTYILFQEDIFLQKVNLVVFFDRQILNPVKIFLMYWLFNSCILFKKWKGVTSTKLILGKI